LDQLADGSLDFETAKAKVQRPNTSYDADSFVAHVKALHQSKAMYRKVIIFPDNSGADLILGVIPLARFFIQLDATVVLAANSLPAINDITVRNLQRVIPRQYTHI
jgi:type II pantothenate kinase